jgi:hypothetical protein
MSLTVRTVVELIEHASSADDMFLLLRAAEEARGAGIAVPVHVSGEVVSRYAKLGIITSAAEWLQGVPELRGKPEVVAGLRKSKDRRVAWSSLHRRFRANLDALVGKHPELISLVDHAESLEERFELYQSGDGNFHIRRSEDGVWLPMLTDHRRVAETWANSLQLPMTSSAVFLLGLGLGWRFEQAWKKTHHTFLNASAPIYVVEPIPESLAMVLHLHHWRDMLADPRVRLFTGEDATQSLRAFLMKHPTWSLANQCFVHLLQPAAPALSVTDVITDVHQSRIASRQSLELEAESRYSGRDGTFWAKRFSRAVDEQGHLREAGEPLRIVGLTTRHSTFLQYAMRDFMDAAKELGHQTHILIEPSDYEGREPGDFAKACIEFEPDLVLNISRLRAEMGLRPANIPAVCWDQDALPGLITEERRSLFTPLDFLIGFSAKSAVATGWPATRCGQPRMAASSNTYSPDRLPDDELAEYACDFSYVSHQSATPEAERDAGILYYQKVPPVSTLFADAIDTLMQQWRTGTPMPGPYYAVVEDLLETRGITLAENVLADLFWRILRVGDRLFRHEALEWVADYCRGHDRTFDLYGRGWDQHPTLKDCAKGEAGNGRQLRAIYQASRINLQLMAFGFVHQRALDGLMAGGFFLARWTPMDFAAPVMRSFIRRAEQLGITHRDQVPDHSDQALNKQYRALNDLGLDSGCMRSQSPILTAPLTSAVESFPEIEDISFRNVKEFETLAEQFLNDEDRRRQVANAMHQRVKDGFGYAALVRDFLAFVRKGLLVEQQRDGEQPATLKPGLVAMS